MDNQSKIASKWIGTAYRDTSPSIKYIFPDHLGSSNTMCDDTGSFFNREEYYPRPNARLNEILFGQVPFLYARLNDSLFGQGQALGFTSQQYTTSVANARAISEKVGGANRLTYVGHSLGGGLASANALATGHDAVTFNAAGLSTETINRLNLRQYANVAAFIVRGERVTALQGLLGVHTAYGFQIYIGSKLDSFFGHSPGYATMLHLMDSVFEALKYSGYSQL